jgi:hypothetical protein
MQFQRRNSPELFPKSRIQQLADSAQQWAKTLDLGRDPSAHISKTLQGVPNGDERDQLFGAIRRELLRRAANKSEDDKLRLEADVLREDEKRARIQKEAYAHQMRQPRDSWDPKSDG